MQLVSEIRACALDSPDRVRVQTEELFKHKIDPYEFAREPERFDRACEMLDSVSHGNRFGRVLEIGCAEGLFTELLSGRCQSLWAVDISTTALERARQRCRRFDHVQFAEWDVRCGTFLGELDLILAVGVLEYIRRPKILKQAIDRIIRSLRPGGYLLMGNTVAGNDLEARWFGRYLLRGTWINRYTEGDARLEVIATALDQCICPFEHILLRRR
ncbi:MAG: nodulation S family protein [Acidobacteriia bacterium]|nr:nodulation S family protein [Terriglobia bacterium]